MEALGGVGLDLFVHRPGHAVRPRVLDQGGAVFYPVFLAQRREGVSLALGLLAVGQGVVAEFDAVVGEDFLDFERVLRQGVFKAGGGGAHALVVVQLQVDVAGGAVDGDEQAPRVLAQVDLGGVDVQGAGFVGFEGLGGGFFPVRQQVGQAADALALQATVDCMDAGGRATQERLPSKLERVSTGI